MKAKGFFHAPFLVIALLCIGCSQHLLLNQREFADEASKLIARSEVSVQDWNGQQYSGILIEPVRMLPDSSRLMVIQSQRDGKTHQFIISPFSSMAEVIKISTRCNADAGNVFMGGLLGAIGGAPLGALLGDAAKSKYDDTGAPRFYGYVLGSITGFIAGAVMSNSLPGNCVLVLDREAANNDPIHRDGR